LLAPGNSWVEKTTRSVDNPDILLKLAAAAGSGTDALLRTLTGFLKEAAPFDLAEVAVSRPLGFERWTLTDSVEPLAAEDLLFHVIARREALRLDDWSEALSYPRTHEQLRTAGAQSLLALPLNAAGGCEGAIVLGRRFGWAFVGASLRLLWPVAGMTGLCLEKAISAQSMGKEIEGLRRRLDEALADRAGGQRSAESPKLSGVATAPASAAAAPTPPAAVVALESSAPAVAPSAPAAHAPLPTPASIAEGQPPAPDPNRKGRRNGRRAGAWPQKNGN
jgi:hypothetical protein